MNSVSILDEYLKYAEFAKGLAAGTLKQQRRILAAFCKGRDVASATRADVVKYIMQLRAYGNCARTCNNVLSTIRSFYTWATIFADVKVNPAAGIQKMKTPVTMPQFIDKKIVEGVINKITPDTFQHALKLAVISTLYMAGLRSGELSNLRDSDLHFQDRYISVHMGKGAKDRIVPMSARLGYALTNWQANRRATVDSCGLVFCNAEGKPLNHYDVDFLIKCAFHAYAPIELCHPHALRHSFATICLDAGVPIQKIALWMGHSSISTTMHYLSISPVYSRQDFDNIF